MNFIERMFCDECQSDFDRMEKGYNPQNGDCGHLKCKILSAIELIIFIPVATVALIILMPILVFIIILNALGR